MRFGSGREMNKMSERVISRLSPALLAFAEELLARVLGRRAGMSDVHFKHKAR